MPNNDNTKAAEGEVFEDEELAEDIYEGMMIAFKINFFAYLIILPALTILNLLVSPGYFWVPIVALLWGAATILLGVIVKVTQGKFEFYGFKF